MTTPPNRNSDLRSPTPQVAQTREHELRLWQTFQASPGVVYQLLQPLDGPLSFQIVSANSQVLLGVDAQTLQADIQAFLHHLHPLDRDPFLRAIASPVAMDFPLESTWNWVGRWLHPKRDVMTIQMWATCERDKDGTCLWNGLILPMPAVSGTSIRPLERSSEQPFDSLSCPHSSPHAHSLSHSSSQVQSFQLFTHVIDSISDPLFIKDRHHRWVFANDAFCTLVQRSSGEIIGKSDHDLFPKSEADSFYTRDEQVFLTGQVIEDEESITIRDGETRFVLTKKSVFTDDAGQVFLVGTIRDITARKQAEEALHHINEDLERRVEERTQALHDSELRLRALLAAAPVLIFATDAQGLITFIEGKILNAMGIDKGKVIGQPASVLYPDNGEATTSIHTALLGKESVHVSRFEALYFENRYSPIRDDEGQVVGLIGIALDISVRKQIELQLSTSEQLLQLVINNIPQEIFWKDCDSVYLGCNTAFAQAAGLQSPKDIIGLSDYDLSWSPEEADRYRLEDQGVIRGGEAIVHRIEWRRRSHSNLIWCDVNKLPLYDAEGNIVGLLGTVEDITERQESAHRLMESEARSRHQAQELEQAMKELKHTQVKLVQSEKMSSLGQLVAGVAHEINNPVNFIYANVTHAREYARDLLDLLQLYHQHWPNPSDPVAARAIAIDLPFLTEDFPKLLQSMEVGANRIKRIVNSLRTFSRMDESETKAIDIHTGIESTLMILQHRTKETYERPAIEVIRNYGELPLVECYAGQLNQVFMNILSNGIDALEEACEYWRQQRQPFQPRIVVQTQVADAQDVEGDRISIAIRDNGLGVDPAVQHQLFDPFFTTKPIGKGTGMGLSISYEIITTKHGGALSCYSIPGQCTEFVIEIPVQLSGDPIQ